MHSSLLSRAVAYFQGQHSIRPQLRGRLFPILFAAARKLAARLESPQLRAPLSGVIHQTAHPPLCHFFGHEQTPRGRAHDDTSPDMTVKDAQVLGGGVTLFRTTPRIVYIYIYILNDTHRLLQLTSDTKYTVTL